MIRDTLSPEVQQRSNCWNVGQLTIGHGLHPKLGSHAQTRSPIFHCQFVSVVSCTVRKTMQPTIRPLPF